MPDKVMDLLKAKYLLSPIHYEGLQRVEALEIPEKAMREAVLNAIIHRDYASTSNIDLRIFDSTISLWNHGDLPPQLDIEKLKDTHASYPRNKLIANIFYRAGYIEAWGRGIQTIVEEVVTNGLLSPTFTNDKWSFTVTFYRKQAEELSLQQKQSDQTGDVVTPSITELERKSLEVIGQKLTGTHKEFAEILEIGAENGTRVTKKGTEKISEKGTESETKVTENGKRVTENETKVTENKTKVTENGTEVTENEKRVTEKGTENNTEKVT
jgi:ATP-dependent DNA helicase RecG